MAECGYCGREVDRIPTNSFGFYNPVTRTYQEWYVCDSCKLLWLVTNEQAREILSEWEGNAHG